MNTSKKSKKSNKKIVSNSEKLMLLRQNRRDHLYPFVVSAFESQHPGEELEGREFVKYVAKRLEEATKSGHGKVLINLPPKHLKTFIAVCCNAARLLGRQPKLQILIVVGNDKLAGDIVSTIGAIMNAAEYQLTFPTRLKPPLKRSLMTTAGGRARVVLVNGKFTGVNADIVLVDDPADIALAANQSKLDEINSIFDQKIFSRGNKGVKTPAVVVMHRLAENDLSGHLLAQGGWDHICLPFEAEQDEVLQVGSLEWHRMKGDRLRPTFMDEPTLARARTEAAPPGFHYLYQQRAGGPRFAKFDASCFETFDGDLAGAPRVISLDPAQSDKPGADFSVIQIWVPLDGFHVLLDQYRGQVAPEALLKMLRQKCRAHCPSFVLIEGNGPVALLANGLKGWHKRVRIIPPGSKSKISRLMPHVDLIRSGGIKVSAKFAELGAFVEEMTAFPDAPRDDQVDALSQYLNFFNCVGGAIPTLPEPGLVSNSQPRHVRPIDAAPPSSSDPGLVSSSGTLRPRVGEIDPATGGIRVRDYTRGVIQRMMRDQASRK